MRKVIFYTKENCSLCEDARALLLMFENEYPFELEERDIYTNDEWLEKYHLLIPVIQVNDVELNCEEISVDEVERVLGEDIK